MALDAPNATYSEDLYRFHWPALGVECLIERFMDRRDDIATELTVNFEHPLYGGRLYSGRLLLIGPNSRRDVKRALEDRVAEVDWDGVLEQICLLARERYRRGEPPVDLASVDFQERARFLLEPWVVRNGISILYGDGGTAKSLFALRWCLELAMQGIKSLYLDWEDDQATHAERLLALCCGLSVEVPSDMIFYQRRSTPVKDSVREIRRFAAEHGIEHSVFDSASMAAGDPNDHGLMIEAVRAARALEISTTLIHHLPKDARDKSKPFGSVYASNEARLTWLVEKAQEEGKDELALVFTNHKYNRGRLAPKRAYKVSFVNDSDLLLSVEFTETEIGQIAAFRGKLPQWRLIADVLKQNGKLRPADIQQVLAADGLEISIDIIGANLRRHNGSLFIRMEGGVWGVKS